MFVMGDEFARTQDGHDNPYDIDSPLTWVDWGRLDEWRELHDTVRHLLRLRRSVDHSSVRCFGVNGAPDIGYGSRSLAWATGSLYVCANAWWEPLSFQVTVHVEGAPLTWVSDAVLSARAERELLDGAEELLRFSAGRVSASDVQRTTRRVGRQIGELLLGRGVREALDDLAPSAVMLDVDETVLNLPWELAGALERELALEVPLGRLVSSRVRPRPRRRVPVRGSRFRGNPTTPRNPTMPETPLTPRIPRTPTALPLPTMRLRPRTPERWRTSPSRRPRSPTRSTCPSRWTHPR